MPLEYESKPVPPKPELYASKQPRHGGCVGGCVGAILGGVVLPIGLGIYCAVVLKDMGGPLFWPIIAIAGGAVGLVAGMVIGTLLHLCTIFWPGRR